MEGCKTVNSPTSSPLRDISEYTSYQPEWHVIIRKHTFQSRTMIQLFAQMDFKRLSLDSDC